MFPTFCAFVSDLLVYIHTISSDSIVFSCVFCINEYCIVMVEMYNALSGR